MSGGDVAARANGYLRWSVLPLALAGLGITAYLTAHEYGDTTLACGPVGDCGYVQSSPYGSLGPIPVSTLGCALYAVVLAVALLAVARPARSAAALLVLLPLTVGGFLYSAYLTYVEFFVLEALCVWCLASAGILTAIFALTSLQVAWERA